MDQNSIWYFTIYITHVNSIHQVLLNLIQEPLKLLHYLLTQMWTKWIFFCNNFLMHSNDRNELNFAPQLSSTTSTTIPPITTIITTVRTTTASSTTITTVVPTRYCSEIRASKSLPTTTVIKNSYEKWRSFLTFKSIFPYDTTIIQSLQQMLDFATILFQFQRIPDLKGVFSFVQ